MLTLSEVVHAVKLGASLEALIPPEADFTYWQRLVDRALANETNPKHRRPSAHHPGQTHHRPSAAEGLARVTALATVELVERANRQEMEEV